MSRGVNKVIIIGNCCADPECKYLPNGGAVTNVSVATSESWKDKESGQPQQRTEFHRAVFFNRLGEIAGEYLKKGSKVYIEGSLRTRKWQAQDGTDRYSTEIVASEMQILSGKGDSNQESAQQQPEQPRSAPRGNAQPQQEPVATPPAGFDSFDDDIPF